MSSRKPGPYVPTLQETGWEQWLLSWLLGAHNPEGLGSPKAKSMGLCFPQAQLLPHSLRRCSENEPLAPAPGATWARAEGKAR